MAASHTKHKLAGLEAVSLCFVSHPAQTQRCLCLHSSTAPRLKLLETINQRGSQLQKLRWNKNRHWRSQGGTFSKVPPGKTTKGWIPRGERFQIRSIHLCQRFLQQRTQERPPLCTSLTSLAVSPSEPQRTVAAEGAPQVDAGAPVQTRAGVAEVSFGRATWNTCGSER